MEKDYHSGILFFLVSFLFSYPLLFVTTERNTLASELSTTLSEKGHLPRGGVD